MNKMTPKTLNAKNLEVLGAARLAELLIEISSGDAVAERRLRLELAGQEGAAAVAREVRKRLATIARSRSLVDWHSLPSLGDDLEMHRRAIMEQVAQRDPAEALDLMWRFLKLARPVYERRDDGGGTVRAIFSHAVRDLGEIAKTAKPEPTALADDVFQALLINKYGQYDSLIHALSPTLGRQGLERLKQRIRSEQSGDSTVRRRALMDIADAQGDVDAYIAQYDEAERQRPKVAAGIARRLLAANRVGEACRTLETVAAWTR